MKRHGLEITTKNGLRWASNCPGAVAAVERAKTQDELYDHLLQCVTTGLEADVRWRPGQVRILDDEDQVH